MAFISFVVSRSLLSVLDLHRVYLPFFLCFLLFSFFLNLSFVVIQLQFGLGKYIEQPLPLPLPLHLSPTPPRSSLSVPTITCANTLPGYHIAHMAIKTVFDALDNLQSPPADITFVKEKMFQHFGVDSQEAMLPHLYTNFKKEEFSSFAKLVAQGAEQGDALCIQVLARAGDVLGRHVVALLPKVPETTRNDVLQVVCVGSVFKAWAFLKDAFIAAVARSVLQPARLRLLRLNATAALGAASLGGRSIGLSPVIHYDENATVLYDSAVAA